MNCATLDRNVQKGAAQAPLKEMENVALDTELKGKRALVLGASQGLGAAIAEKLAAQGCDLVLAARNSQKLEEEAARLNKAHGGVVFPLSVDLGDPDSVAAFILGLADKGDIDILVLNAGGPPGGSALEVADEIWRTQFEAMVLSQIRVVEAIVPGMQERGFGRVIAVSSSGIAQPIPNLVVSNALRAALANYLKTLAGEVAADGVTVNILMPGRIETARTTALDTMQAKKRGTTFEDVRAKSLATIPTGRLGHPDEFAQAAVFLASGAASYVTGSILRVDGGMVRGL